MNKLFFGALLLTVVMACSPRASVEKTAETTLDTAAVVQRVNEIYTKAFDGYKRVDVNAVATEEATPSADSLFTTRDWKDMVAAVGKKDAQKTYDDGMGFFEADYWIMGQDWQDLSVSDIQVVTMTDSTATVTLNLHNCGSVTAVRLDMKLEDGKWKIDNFIDASNDYDWKARMKEYLENEK